MTSFLSAISVGRRRRWLVFGVALVLIAVAAPLGTKFQNAQQNDPSAFLPGGAESVRSLDQQRRFPSGAETPAADPASGHVGHRRPGGEDSHVEALDDQPYRQNHFLQCHRDEEGIGQGGVGIPRPEE